MPVKGGYIDTTADFKVIGVRKTALRRKLALTLQVQGKSIPGSLQVFEVREGDTITISHRIDVKGEDNA